MDGNTENSKLLKGIKGARQRDSMYEPDCQTDTEVQETADRYKIEIVDREEEKLNKTRDETQE